MTTTSFTISMDLSFEDAHALAQLMKRIGFSEIRINAANDDEAYLMRTACERVQEALAQAGFAPR